MWAAFGSWNMTLSPIQDLQVLHLPSPARGGCGCRHLIWDHSCWFRILTLLSMLLNEEQRIENTQWSVIQKTSKCWFGNLACFSVLKQVLIRSWSVSLKRVIGLAIASSSQRPSSGDLLPSLSYVGQAGSCPYPGVVGHRLGLSFLDFVSVFSDFSVLPVTSWI